MRAAILPFTLALALGCATSDSTRRPTEDVRDFVRRTYIHGVPYEEAIRFGGDDVPVLLRMLRDPAETEHWSNIAVTLCMIGDERCVEPTIAFIEEGGGRLLSDRHYRAKSAAIMSLGYVVHRNENRRCIGFLENACTPSYWPSRGIDWFQRRGPTGSQRDQELSTMAILGLGLAGTRETRAALEELARDPDRFFRSSRGLIASAIQTNREIERLGLAEYYRRGKH